MSDTFVYFIASTRSRAVKIGVSDQPHQRLADLQCASASRLKLLALMPGDERYERALHAAFAEHRVRGEWFRIEGRLAEFVGLLPPFDATRPVPVASAKREQLVAPTPIGGVERLNAHFEAMNVLIRDAVLEFGVERFAALVGATRSNVARAIHGHGRYFALDWFFYLAAVVPRDVAFLLATTVASALGFRLAEDGTLTEIDFAEAPAS